MTQFQEFKQRTEREVRSNSAREAYASGDPNLIQQSRDYAINSINETPEEERPFPAPETPAEVAQIRENNNTIEALLDHDSTRATNRARGFFLDNREEIIADAPEDKLARGYLAVTPYKIGDANHDAIVDTHKKYAELSDMLVRYEVEPREGEQRVKHQDIIDKVAGHIAGEVDESLANVQYADDKEKAKAKNAALALLGASEAYAVRMLKNYAEKAKEALERALPDDKARAGYAAENLNAEQDPDKARSALYAITK